VYSDKFTGCEVKDVKQKTVLVTGAGGGIGQQVALKLSKAGMKVYANERSLDGLAGTLELFSRLPLAIIPLPFDVSKENEVEKAMQEVEQLDYLVNNAGICPPLIYEELKVEDWEQIFSINVIGTYLCMRYASDIMTSPGGSIVNISSGASKTGGAYVSIPYAASKAAVNSLTLSYAKRLAPRGIRVNAVAPGFIDTKILREMPVTVDEIKKEIPLGRIGSPHEVAGCVHFLFSESASFITGEIIDVNGGDVMD
jgi:3-oxoacyl-[acyl-carrier protein] reductase